MADKRPLVVDAGRVKELPVADNLAVSAGITSPDFIDFDTTATSAGAVGRVTWNDGDGTLDVGLKGGNVTLQVGQEEVVRVYNGSGVTLNPGAVVIVTGAQGNRIAVTRGQANSEATSVHTLGIVTETISSGVEGFVTTSGLVRQLNTINDSDGNALVEGDTVYLSPTTLGGFTKVKPTAPNHLVVVGFVVRVHATVGSIFVKVDNGYELDELHNVLITSPSVDQVLKWDGTKWVNGAGGGTGAGVPTGGTSGQVLAKVDGTDYNTAWVSVPAPKVTTSTTTSSTHSLNWSASDVIRLTLNHSITSLTITGAQDGQKMILEVTQGTGGSFTITWPSSVRFGTDITSITLSTTAGKKDRIGLIYDGTASKYDVIAVVKGF